MLKYELRKLLFRKTTLLFLLFLLAVNTIVIFKNHDQDEDNADYLAYLDAYEDIRGKEIAECKQIVTDKYKALSASEGEEKQFLYALTYDELLMELEDIGVYERHSAELAAQSIEKSEHFKKSNAYLSALNARFAELYGNRSIDHYYNVKSIPSLIGYKFHYVLIILLLIAVVPNVFTDEKSKGTYDIIKTTERGYTKLASIKVAAVLIFAAIASLCFAVCNYVCFQICYEFDGLFQPIYAIWSYRELPANDTIALFLLKNFGLGLLGIGVIALIVILISQLVSETKLAFMSSICLTVLLIFFRGLNYLGIGQALNLLNPIHCLLGEKIMLYFEHICIGSTIISNVCTVTVIALVEMSVLIGLILLLYKKNIEIRVIIGGKHDW